MYDIIFVCTGNTCRSPVAEALAKCMLASEGIKAKVTSAGVSVLAAQPASKHSIAVMRDEGLDLTAHKSRPLTREMTACAKLILTMTRGHLLHVSGVGENAQAFTLGEYAGRPEVAVMDPFGGSAEEYRACAAQIKELLNAALPRIKEALL